jgi:excinuclease ABC subunit B
MTDSMQRAIDETERRRERQIAFNRQHGIEPKTIIKSVQDIMEGARSAVPRRRRERGGRAAPARRHMSRDQLVSEIARVEREMHRHARELEFEQAAKLRDEANSLRQALLDLPASAAI